MPVYLEIIPSEFSGPYTPVSVPRDPSLEATAFALMAVMCNLAGTLPCPCGSCELCTWTSVFSETPAHEYWLKLVSIKTIPHLATNVKLLSLQGKTFLFVLAHFCVKSLAHFHSLMFTSTSFPVVAHRFFREDWVAGLLLFALLNLMQYFDMWWYSQVLFCKES